MKIKNSGIVNQDIKVSENKRRVYDQLDNNPIPGNTKHVDDINLISDVINDPFSAYLSMFETNALYNELTKTYSVDIDLTSRVQNKKLR